MRTKITTTIFFALCLVMFSSENGSWWRRYQRRCVNYNCIITWSEWSSCSCPCGHGCYEEREMLKTKISSKSCNKCPDLTDETRACNRETWRCRNRSYQKSHGCTCRSGFEGTCCENGEYSSQT